MGSIVSIQSTILLVIHLALLVVTIYAFISSLTFSAQAYRAAGKWSKQGWSILLGFAALLQVVPLVAIGLVQMALVIAAFVYLADVRPALSSLRRR